MSFQPPVQTRERAMSPEEFGNSAVDARVHDRVAVDLPIELHLSGLTHPLSARTRDLSAGGMCLATDSPVAVSEIRRVTIQLGAGQTVDLDAEGKRQSVPDAEQSVLTSLQFVNVAPEVRLLLEREVQDRSRKLAEFLVASELDGLNVDDAAGITRVTRLRRVPARQHVYRQGAEETNAGLFVVYKGEICLDVRLGRGGGREIALSRVRPGGILGGLTLMARMKAVESAWAEDEATLVEISSGAFHYLRFARPLLAQRMTESALRRHGERMLSLFSRLS